MVSRHEFDDSLLLFTAEASVVMGTRLQMVGVGMPQEVMVALWGKMAGDADMLGGILNRYSPGSEVARWNAGRHDGKMSPELERILEVSQEYGRRTGGLFDVSATLRGGLRRTLDFGGIAKGYALERMKRAMEEAGVENAFVDFGSSTMFAMGAHPRGDCWKVSLPSPYDGAVVDTFSLRGTALSVSGNRPGYDGHIVNPQSGLAVLGRKLVAVESPSPLEAEVLSTAAAAADDPRQVEMLRREFPQSKINIYAL